MNTLRTIIAAPFLFVCIACFLIANFIDSELVKGVAHKILDWLKKDGLIK